MFSEHEGACPGLGSGCENGGVCSADDGQYQCVCLAGYTGDLCQGIMMQIHNIAKAMIGFYTFSVNIDECASQPCQNGGTCVDDVNSFTCECSDENSGPHCESKQRIYILLTRYTPIV